MSTMLRKQVYITRDEGAELSAISELTGRAQSELIREAIDEFIKAFHHIKKRSAMDKVFGMWQDRDDLKDIKNIRDEWDRKF